LLEKHKQLDISSALSQYVTQQRETLVKSVFTEDIAMTNNQFPTAEQVAQIRRQYPKGSRIELVWMDDPQAPPIGTNGTVIGVDDIGSLIIVWDNGSHLNAAFGEDIVRLLPGLSEAVKEQLCSIRDTGLTNMLDTAAVQRLAYDRGYFELVDFIRNDQKQYVTFIMTGNVE